MWGGGVLSPLGMGLRACAPPQKNFWLLALKIVTSLLYMPQFLGQVKRFGDVFYNL